MSNTATENELAVSAFKAIVARYGKHLNINPSVKSFSEKMMSRQGVEVYIKFMDNTSFINNFSRSKSATRLANCAICGFTVPQIANKYDREMYINRQYANASTVVHEMLHFLTHPLFASYVGPILIESVTEYFTRKVIGSTKDPAFDIGQRKNHYDTHHTLLGAQRGLLKLAPGRPQKGYMKAAYFQGDVKSIAFIKDNFKDIEEMLADDDS
jgi:hypothetical protein